MLLLMLLLIFIHHDASNAVVTCERKLFQRLCAAREYFPTCSVSLK